MDLGRNLTTLLRVAELTAQLPNANPNALARVRAVAIRPDSGEAMRGIWAVRELDWLTLYCHFGRTRNWLSAQVRTLTPDVLLSMLEADFEFGVPTKRAA